MPNDVRVDVELDTKSAEQEAQTFKGKMANVFGEMGKIAGGIFMAQIGGSLANKGVDTFKNSITLARDFNEIQSKANTIFGESSRAINDWAGNAAVGFGQSKAQALDAAATFGNMFSQLGMGAGVTADMSQKMVELASDFASFHNADITQVLEAQQAAFRGEYDAVQRFVPTINAAAVEMKALEQTGKETTKELTAQEKAVAAYQLMLDNAGAAMGDFERTSGSLSNQQRILSAQWQNLQADIGQALIPALTAIVTTINTQVIPAVAKFAQDVKRYWESDLKPAIENLKQAWADIKPVVQPVIEFVVREVKRIAEIVANVVGIIVDLISGDFSGAWEHAKEIVRLAWEGIRDRIETAIQVIGELGPRLLQLGKDLMQAMFDGITELWTRWIAPFFTNLPGNVLSFMGDALSKLYQWGRDLIQGLIDGIMSMVDKIPNPLDLIPGIGGGGGDDALRRQTGNYDEPNLSRSRADELRAEPGYKSKDVVDIRRFSRTAADLSRYVRSVLSSSRELSMLAGSPVPTGAYGQNLVYDEENNAYTYPWATGGAFGQRDSSGGLVFQPFGASVTSQPITVNVQIDRQTIATAVIDPWMEEQLTTGALQHGVSG